MVSRLWTVGLAALCCALFGVGAAYAATLNVPLPVGCTMIAVTCADLPPGPPSPPAPPSPPLPPSPPPAGGFAACTAAGFTAQVIEMRYPLPGDNQRVDTSGGPRFGNADALIVHFRTPAADPSGGAHFSMIYRGGAPQVLRVAALATVPCIFPAAYSLTLPAGTLSQGPTFNLSLTPKFGWTVLAPDTDYYITFTNRNGFFAAGSCPALDCAVFIDAN